MKMSPNHNNLFIKSGFSNKKKLLDNPLLENSIKSMVSSLILMKFKEKD